MGLLDSFKKKEDNIVLVHSKLSHFKGAVLQSFSHLREDLTIQKQWIHYLNNIHHVLNNAHEKHRELTGKEMQELKRWINHLYKNAKRHEDSMKALEKHLSHTIELYNKQIISLHDKVSKSAEREQKLRNEIMDDIAGLVEEKHRQHSAELEESRKSIEAGKKDIEDAKKDLETGRKELDAARKELQHKIDLQLEKAEHPAEVQRDATLTNPEQKLLNLLLAESDPVSYGHIAEKTGNSVNTVRVIMNNLKKRGLIEEHTLPSGVKLFNATNKERIKKLYNISG